LVLLPAQLSTDRLLSIANAALDPVPQPEIRSRVVATMIALDPVPQPEIRSRVVAPMIALDPVPQPEIRSRVVAPMIALDPLPDVLSVCPVGCLLLLLVHIRHLALY
jgi:hypothetical protein